MVKMGEEFRDKGLVIVGIVRPEQNDPDWAKTRGVIAEYKLTFPTLVDKDGAVNQAYNIRGIPRTFIIGPDGIVRDDILGAQPEEVFRAGLKQAGIQ